MNGPFSQGFRKACQVEFDTLVRKDCWEVVQRPKNRSVVSSTGVFKIKRYPDGSMRKLRKACQVEFDTLVRKDCWEVVQRPKNRSVVSSTWIFTIKRYPDGSMRKLKARFCARGYEQIEGLIIALITVITHKQNISVDRISVIR
jgi:hypothetical protein